MIDGSMTVTLNVTGDPTIPEYGPPASIFVEWGWPPNAAKTPPPTITLTNKNTTDFTITFAPPVTLERQTPLAWHALSRTVIKVS